MLPRVVRTNVDRTGQAIGTGDAIRGPSRPPWPRPPWHCQQPVRSKLALPFAASPAGAAICEAKAEDAANTATDRVEPARNTNVFRMALLLTRLSDDVDQHGFAHLDCIYPPFDRDRQILRIGDRTDADMAQGFCKLRIIDVRIPDRCADVRILDAALAPIGHALKMHDLLMVGPVVPHDGEHWNLVMRRRPERARSIHGVAVVLDVCSGRALDGGASQGSKAHHHVEQPG